jgi:FtsZ-interacting cell division protein ZipA|tara:strand:+ start:220 stop:420 length:201 start_codon:yes stop_codon:yes gene_type:complete
MGTILVIVSIIVVLYLVVFPWMDQNTRQPNYSEEEKKKIKKSNTEQRNDNIWVFVVLIFFLWYLFG